LRRAWLERKNQATAAIQDLRWKRRAARLGKKPAPEEKEAPVEAPTEEKALVEETKEEGSEEKAPQAPKEEAPEKNPTKEAPEKTEVPPVLFPE